jgi:hypothetical protein
MVVMHAVRSCQWLKYPPSDVRPFDATNEKIVRLLVRVEDSDIVAAPHHTKITNLMVTANKVKIPAS